jgi:hypothetical protein
MRGIQYAAASRFKSSASLEYWVARSSRAMTCKSMARLYLSNTPSHSRGAMRPRFGRTFVPLITEGAGKTGCPMHPQPRVQNLSEAHEHSHRGFAGTPGLPCAMVLTASFVLSPAIGLVCHRRLRIGGEFGPVGPALASANLTPASGRQDHTTSPSATSSFVCAPDDAHKPDKDSPCDSICAPTLSRPPHPAPRS